MKHLNASNTLPSLVLLLLLLLQIILIFQTPTITGAEDWETDLIGVYQCSNNSSNYTSGSKFESNLISDLFPTLITNGSRDGFVMATFGKVPDKVHGLVHCRGDISKEDCRSCLKLSTVNITQTCPNKRSAGIRLGNCLIRYSDISFFNQSNMNYTGSIWPNDKPIPNLGVFYQKLDGLFTNLNSDASKIPSRFMTGWTTLSDLSTLYGLVQCTKDLSITDCFTCIQKMVDAIPSCCSGAKGVWIPSLSCQIMYDDYLFFRLPSPPPLLPPPPTVVVAPLPQQTTGKSPNVAIIVVPIIIGSLLLLSVTLCCVYFAKRKTRKTRETTEAASITGPTDLSEVGMWSGCWHPVEQQDCISFEKIIRCQENSIPLEYVPVRAAGTHIKREESLQYDLVTLINATQNFSDANILGEGGFAVVYKGELQDGEEIAVKRLTSTSVQGPEHFNNEMALLHKLQHRNLVRLLGYCLEGEETILIYEYVPNRSLDKYLFDPLKRVSLDWGTRYKIIRGIARGLLYLHEDSRLRIIHRDLKAGNILLDREMNPRIADFGTAKLFGVDQTTGNTSKIAGTFGYMAPEYVLHGLFSVKSDVFSFGVLLLEIVSGQKINSFQQSNPPADLLSYAWKHWSEGTSIEFIDPTLKDNCLTNEVTRSIHVGLLCVQENIEDRPTMSFVVNMLDNSIPLASPAQPSLFTFRGTGLNAVKREIESYDPSTNSSISLSSKGLSLDETNLR